MIPAGSISQNVAVRCNRAVRALPVVFATLKTVGIHTFLAVVSYPFRVKPLTFVCGHGVLLDDWCRICWYQTKSVARTDVQEVGQPRLTLLETEVSL